MLIWVFPGRSLNSCQMAFAQMHHQQIQPPLAPRTAVSHPPPMCHESTAPGAPSESSGQRKRPLYPLPDRPQPLAPRAIQPRPAPNMMPYSREESAPNLASPGLDEPPRKRGRPSKAETERRKAAAEAKGETYPPPHRRTDSGKPKLPSTPNSPAGTLASAGNLFSPPASLHGPERSKPENRYQPPVGRARASTSSGISEQRSRELPRPLDVRQTLPSPQALQLGHPEVIPRLNATESPFERLPQERIPRAFDGSRQILPDPARSKRPDQPPVSAAPSLGTSVEKPG